jgi:type II secretory pathway pseudopilin PulG
MAESDPTHHDERGYALLGMLLALAIIAIMLAGVVPNVQMDVRRDKEEEMLFRGQEMARAIARYYNFNTRGLPGPIQLNVPPPYGYLYDLNKLRDGITLGVNELKFVRPSAMRDPLLNKEWEPVRARDPRLMQALQAWAGANNLPIPSYYMILAAPPAKLHIINTGDGSQRPGGGGNVVGAGGQQQGSAAGGSGIQGGPGGQSSGTGTGGQPIGGQAGKKPPNQNADDDDDDDDDADPLAHLMHSDNNNGLPIVAVVPRLKGKAVHAFYGMTNYEQWVFIYIPPQPLLRPGQTTIPNQNTGNPGGLKVSQ